MKDNNEVKDSRTRERGDLKRRFLIHKDSELVWQERHKNELPVQSSLFSSIGKPGREKMIQLLLPRPPLIASTDLLHDFIPLKSFISIVWQDNDSICVAELLIEESQHYLNPVQGITIL